MGFLFNKNNNHLKNKNKDNNSTFISFEYFKNSHQIQALQKQVQLKYIGFREMVQKHSLDSHLRIKVKVKLKSFFASVLSAYNGENNEFKSILQELTSPIYPNSKQNDVYVEKVNSAMTNTFCTEILENAKRKRIYEYCLQNMKRILLHSSDELIEEDYLHLPPLKCTWSFFIKNERKILIKTESYAHSYKYVNQIILTLVSLKSKKHEIITIKQRLERLKFLVTQVNEYRTIRYVIIMTSFENLESNLLNVGSDMRTFQSNLIKEITSELTTESKAFVKFVFGNVYDRATLVPAFEAMEKFGHELTLLE